MWQESYLYIQKPKAHFQIGKRYRPEKMTWDNTGTFAYDLYEDFLHKMETAALALNLEDDCNWVDFAEKIAWLKSCIVNPQLVNWIGVVCMDNAPRLANAPSMANVLRMVNAPRMTNAPRMATDPKWPTLQPWPTC